MRCISNRRLRVAAAVFTAAVSGGWLWMKTARQPGAPEAGALPGAVTQSDKANERRPAQPNANAGTAWNGLSPAVETATASDSRKELASILSENPRPGSEEWETLKAVLINLGERAGREAVEELLSGDRAKGSSFDHSSAAFEGWARVNPQAAWEWLADNSDGRLRSAFLPRFKSGTVDASAATAIGQFAEHSVEEKAAMAVQTMREVLETGGYRAADVLLDEEFFPRDGHSPNEAVLRTLFDTVATHRAQAVQNGGSLEETCDWLATYSDRRFARQEHFSKAAEQLATQNGSPAAADWLASLATDDASGSVKAALAENIRNWSTEDPAAANGWLESQRDHPAYEVMVSRVPGARSGDPKAASTPNITPK